MKTVGEILDQDIQTWYEIEGYGSFTIRPIQVVKQTAKTITVMASDRMADRGTRDYRRLMCGDFFDNLESANAAVRARLQIRYDRATKAQQDAANALKAWKDVTF